MARGFIGNQYGPAPVPSTARPANLSGVFSMDDQYYIRQNGGWAEPTGLVATGGVISDYVSGPAVYRSHVFYASGSFVVSQQSNDPTIPSACEMLVLAGGGAGGSNTPALESGGGGGGGAADNPNMTIPNGTYKVVIGAGGAPGGTVKKGGNGGNTFFGPPSPGADGPSPPNGVTCLGGGGGASSRDGGGGADGGCGGGGAGPPNNSSNQSTATQPTVTQGWPGFTQYGGSGDYPGNSEQSAGGGGIDGNGGQMHAPWGEWGGDGRNGRDWTWAIGSRIHYGAGGGSQTSPTHSNKGQGGGNDFPYPSTPIGGPFLPTAGDGRSNFGNHNPPVAAPNGSTQWYPFGSVSPVSGYPGRGGGGAGLSLTNINPEGSPYQSPGRGGYGGSGTVVVRYKISTVQTGTAKATGGEISFYGGKCIHTFTNSGDFTVTNPTALTCEYFMIAGGGGGGMGGGGAGGFLTASAPVSPGSPNKVTITIGGGGQGSLQQPHSVNFNGLNGGDTKLTGGITATAAGGGGGSSNTSPTGAGSAGGSGGGGSQGDGEGGAGATYPTVSPSPGGSAPGQGYAGGDGGPGASAYSGGGGGGAGGVGQAGTATVAGDGGIGIQIPATFRDPKSTIGAPGPGSTTHWVGGGGGGGTYGGPGSPPTAAYVVGDGGMGTPSNPGGPFAGGGKGGSYPNSQTMEAGVSGTGGGGGGTYIDASAKQGGSGIVLIAYDA